MFALVGMLNATAVSAQTEMAEFASMLENSRLVLKFNFNVQDQSGKSFQGNGDLVFQGGAYCFSSNGIKVISNGKDMWTVSRDNHEVVVEAAVPVDLKHPEQLLPLIGQNTKNTDIKVDYDANGLPSSIVASMKNGGRLKVTVTKARLEPESPSLSDFTFDTASLGSSWTVTDLR